MRRRSAARSYLVLAGSAEFAPHPPASPEVARRVATMHHRSAVRSYLVLVGSAELAPHPPASLEVARRTATMRRRSAAHSYLVLAGSAEFVPHPPASPEVARKAATMRRRSAVWSYLALVGSAESALHSPASSEVAREAQTTPEEAKTEEAARTEHHSPSPACSSSTKASLVPDSNCAKPSPEPPPPPKQTRSKNCSPSPRQISEPQQKANSCDEQCGATRYLLAAVLSGTIRDYTGGCGMKCNNCGGLSVLLGLLGGNTCSRFCANRRVTSGGAVLGQASGVGAHLFYSALVGKV